MLRVRSQASTVDETGKIAAHNEIIALAMASEGSASSSQAETPVATATPLGASVAEVCPVSGEHVWSGVRCLFKSTIAAENELLAFAKVEAAPPHCSSTFSMCVR